MSVSVLLNAALLILSISCTATAVTRVAKIRSVEGIALLTTSLGMFSCLTWTAYALMIGNPIQVVTSCIGTAGGLYILATAHATNALHFGRVVVGLSIYAPVAFALAYFGGSVGLGVAVSSLTFVTLLPQTVRTWRRPGGVGVSVASQSIGAFQSILWTLTGVIRGDIWLTASSFYALCNATFVAARTAQARRRPATKTRQSEPARVQEFELALSA